MKNVNLTQLYIDLVTKCGVNGFEVSSIRKTNSPEPEDLSIDFYLRDIEGKSIKKEDVDVILDNNISGEVKQKMALITDTRIHIYIEFKTSEVSDEYAYNKEVIA